MPKRPSRIGLRATALPAAAGESPSRGARVWWLGQAGFLIRGPEAAFIIDPYLSDSLAEKYRGREFPHVRMMPVPIQPDQLAPVDAVLVTHGHTDHLDPGTLPGLAAANPRAVFVLPRAVVNLALERGVPGERILSCTAGESVSVPRSRGGATDVTGGAGGTVDVNAVASAHERLATDEEGNHLYLGYVFTLGGVTFYHSGDSVPYPGLVEVLAPQSIDVALLPVNGRDEYRASRGVPGNFTVAEARELAGKIGASYVVAHHFGMFDFNTVSRTEAKQALQIEEKRASRRTEPILPEVGIVYHFA